MFTNIYGNRRGYFKYIAKGIFSNPKSQLHDTESKSFFFSFSCSVDLYQLLTSVDISLLTKIN